MGMVHSNQPIFTSPAHLARRAIEAVRQLFKPTEEPAPSPVTERPYDPVIDWELDLPNTPPLVPEVAQWFLLLVIWWIATVLAADQWGLL
ncbi:hypothetical protein [Dyella sp. 2RAB6]|uniref:hypothetical protein n=1 Tax=Dyella sp. 2RAB6 TaxID=3232992 RepID=UPI003F91230F